SLPGSGCYWASRYHSPSPFSRRGLGKASATPQDSHILRQGRFFPPLPFAKKRTSHYNLEQIPEDKEVAVMAEHAQLRKKVDELAERTWDVEGIRARVARMAKQGIPRKKLDPGTLLAQKQEILDRVQRRAEEYNFIFKNCAQGTAMALMEEFGLGNMEIIKALTTFPGIGGTGEICGGITGSLITFGLFFGSDDPLDLSIMEDPLRNPMIVAQKLIAFFEDTIGHIHCSDIIENVILGHPLNPGESEAAMVQFTHEKGFEKCGLPPGIGARLAAEFIIDSFKTRA
ncbi:MAG: C-GCAxxG-C-C family protein, partial [Dehalococcoidales bacterium]|nr:C-GCAxxG-C-C family protein [Dehalococcoidales bacterium]